MGDPGEAMRKVGKHAGYRVTSTNLSESGHRFCVGCYRWTAACTVILLDCCMYSYRVHDIQVLTFLASEN